MTIEARLENMQNQLSSVLELLQISINSLNTKKSVASFLGKSQKTIEFIPIAIVEFKKNPIHKIKTIEDKKEDVNKTIILSKTTSKILKGVI
jgi:hypothetical protein